MLTFYPLTGKFHALSLDRHHFSPLQNAAFYSPPDNVVGRWGWYVSQCLKHGWHSLPKCCLVSVPVCSPGALWEPSWPCPEVRKAKARGWMGGQTTSFYSEWSCLFSVTNQYIKLCKWARTCWIVKALKKEPHSSCRESSSGGHIPHQLPAPGPDSQTEGSNGAGRRAGFTEPGTKRAAASTGYCLGGNFPCKRFK